MGQAHKSTYPVRVGIIGPAPVSEGWGYALVIAATATSFSVCQLPLSHSCSWK